MSTVSEPSFRHLLRDLAEDTTRLMQDQVDLAALEMKEKARLAARQSLFAMIGGALAIFGFFALLCAVTLGLAHALSALVGLKVALWLSPLIMGLVGAGVGAWLVWRAVLKLRAESLAPRRTLQSLRAHGQWMLDRLA
jgi:hypothetical protein